MSNAAALALAAGPNARKLRIGLVCGSLRQPRWLVDAFASVAAAEFAEITVLAGARRGETTASKGAGAPPLLALYAKLDRWAFGADASELADLREAVAHRRFMGAPAPAELRELDLDVLFALGELDDGDYDGVARYGVWRYCFGPQLDGRESLAGFREVADGMPLTGSGIRARMAPGTVPRLVYRSWSRTYPLSLARNRERLLRKTAQFACRALRELQRSGRGWLEQCKPAEEPGQRPAPAPQGWALARDLGAIGTRIARRGLEKALQVDQWFLAFRFHPATGVPQLPPASLEGYARLLPPKDRTWADPFALEKNGRYFVFFEELPFRAGKGHIAMIELARDGSHSAPVRVLEREYHLSYPFLVEHDGQLLMIPETAQNGTVEVWRCVDFPLRWRREKVLLDGVRCVDATFHRGPDRWWMFANLAAPGSRMFDDELHLFHAAGLLGEWRAHPCNPVKSDARCARPAGALFRSGGALYRPAQICAPLYGTGLSINRVLRLTPHHYAERQVKRILPPAGDGVLGLHTVNRAGDMTVIDGFMRRRRL